MIFLFIADFLLRFLAILGLLPAFGFWAAMCAMGTDSGTNKAKLYSLLAFILGCALAGMWLWMAIYPDVVQDLIPGPFWLGVLLVRGQVYALAALLGWVFFRQ